MYKPVAYEVIPKLVRIAVMYDEAEYRKVLQNYSGVVDFNEPPLEIKDFPEELKELGDIFEDLETKYKSSIINKLIGIEEPEFEMPIQRRNLLKALDQFLRLDRRESELGFTLCFRRPKLIYDISISCSKLKIHSKYMIYKK